MAKAAERYHSVIQCGHGNVRITLERAGRLYPVSSFGPISKVDVWRYGGNEVPVVPDGPVPAGVDYDLWLGPHSKGRLTRTLHYNFRWFWDYAGGKMTDWGVHLLDMAMWL
jgi:hypothetical protein